MKPKPGRILALETSGRVGSVALASHAGGDLAIVGVCQLPGEMRHASELMPAVAHLLEGQGWQGDSITDVFVSIGPGSFTGLRIGVSIARTLAWSVGARVVAVPTVDCLACNGLEADPVPEHLAVMIDAKRDQVFTALFERQDAGYAKRIDAHMAGVAEMLARCPKPVWVLGEGVARHREAIDASGAGVVDRGLWSARAENVIRVGWEMARGGQFTPGGRLLPLYIRRPDPEEKWEKLHGKGA